MDFFMNEKNKNIMKRFTIFNRNENDREFFYNEIQMELYFQKFAHDF